MMMRVPILALLLFMASATVEQAWAAGMNAWLDRTRIGAGETVQLVLEVEGQVNVRPDTGPLEQDFEILGLSTGSRVNIVNGRTDARTTWTLTLSPRHPGTLTIPALHAGKYTSYPLTLEVTAAAVPVSGAGDDILIETAIEPGESYVQGQVLYTVRLLHAVPLSEGRLSEPEPDNTLVQRLGDDREFVITRDGRRYQAIERRYALFPQHSGPLELAAPVFDGAVPDSGRRRESPLRRLFDNDPFFGSDLFDDMLTPTRRVRVRGVPTTVQVLSRPDGAQGVHWLPAGNLQLQGTWQPDTQELRVGEPVTLLLELTAEGLTGGQLPNLVPERVDGFRVYPDQAQRETASGQDGVTGQLRQKVAFIPERAGQLALPAIVVHWWDTVADQERVATLPGRITRVAPAVGQTAPAARQPAPPGAAGAQAGLQTGPDTAVPQVAALAVPQDSLLWPWISVALASGWLITLVVWWLRSRGRRATSGRKRPASPAPAATATLRRQFHAACAAGDASGAQRHLLSWAAAHWPADPPQGLEALARRLPDPAAREALAELNRTLYRDHSQWNGAHLKDSLRQLPEQVAVARSGRSQLAPLYPGWTPELPR